MIRGILEAFSSDLAAQQAKDVSRRGSPRPARLRQTSDRRILHRLSRTSASASLDPRTQMSRATGT